MVYDTKPEPEEEQGLHPELALRRRSLNSVDMQAAQCVSLFFLCAGCGIGRMCAYMCGRVSFLRVSHARVLFCRLPPYGHCGCSVLHLIFLLRAVLGELPQTHHCHVPSSLIPAILLAHRPLYRGRRNAVEFVDPAEEWVQGSLFGRLQDPARRDITQREAAAPESPEVAQHNVYSQRSGMDATPIHRWNRDQAAQALADHGNRDGDFVVRWSDKVCPIVCEEWAGVRVCVIVRLDVKAVMLEKTVTYDQKGASGACGPAVSTLFMVLSRYGCTVALDGCCVAAGEERLCDHIVPLGGGHKLQRHLRRRTVPVSIPLSLSLPSSVSAG